MITIESTFATVTLEDDKAYKRFHVGMEDVFFRELFYLSLFRSLKISEILDADYTTRTITMKRYDGSLGHLAMKVNSDKRAIIADQIAKQLLPTIYAIHSVGVTHRDINIGNILYIEENDEYSFFLSDFSIATYFEEDKPWEDQKSIYTDPCNTCNNRATDMWMLGATIWQFITCNDSVHYITKCLEYGKTLDEFRTIIGAWKIPDRLSELLHNILSLDGNKRNINSVTHPLLKLENEGKDVVRQALIGAGFSGNFWFNVMFTCFNDGNGVELVFNDEPNAKVLIDTLYDLVQHD